MHGCGCDGRAVGGVVGVVMTAFGKREINRQEATSKRSHPGSKSEEAKSEAADTDVRILPFIPGPC